MRGVIERTPRFVERVFTASERDYCESRGASKHIHYAARFAAKEAAMKALGTGWGDGMKWHDIEVARTDRGAPLIILNERAREIFLTLGATRAHLSISHTNEHAVAHVIFEATDAPKDATS